MTGITYIQRITGSTNNLVYLETTDTTATATGSGYITAQTPTITALNEGAWTWETNDCIMLSASDGISWCSINASFTTLTAFAGFGSGDVTYTSPSIANHIAYFTNTTGNISQDGATVINAGNIQAGVSGTAGDFVSYPATAANGTFVFKAVNNSNNHAATLSNAAIAQATVYTLPDPGASTSNVAVTTGATVSGNLVKASGVAGQITDQGVAMKVGKQVAVAGGNAAQTVTDAFCATTSSVIASWNDTTNACEIKTVAAGNGSFVVTSTADPGASHLNYVIYN